MARDNKRRLACCIKQTSTNFVRFAAKGKCLLLQSPLIIDRIHFAKLLRFIVTRYGVPVDFKGRLFDVDEQSAMADDVHV